MVGNFPDSLFQKYKSFIEPQLTIQQFEGLIQALEEMSPNTFIRYNPGKSALINNSIGQRIPWSKWGYKLTERPVFSLDPYFHAGVYYVQEASSMLIEHVLSQLPFSGFERVLDLCASPGGKSTQLLGFLNEDTLVVSNEVIKSRNDILNENLTKWGYINIVVTQNDPSHFASLTGFFDLILVDAPCSGEGLFRKDPSSLNQWSEDQVHMCQRRQRRIVEDVWDSIKEGGYLIYSTCTLNQLEDELNVKWILENFGGTLVPIPFEEEWPVFDTGMGLKCLPHPNYGEGFFISLIQKTDGEKFQFHNRKVKTNTSDPLQQLITLKDVAFHKQEDKMMAYPLKHHNAIELLKQKLYLRKLGITLAEIKNKDIIPQQDLANSLILNKEIFPVIELDLEASLSYLRKEELPFDLIVGKRGYHLVCYSGVPLGFIKCLGNRANNLYPKEWRLRM